MPRQRISKIFLYKSGILLEWKSICSNILLDLAVTTWAINVKHCWCLLYFVLFQRYQWCNWKVKTDAFKSGLCQSKKVQVIFCQKLFFFAEHGENMLCTKIVLNVRNNFCAQHVLPRFELGIFMYWTSDKDLPA